MKSEHMIDIVLLVMWLAIGLTSTILALNRIEETVTDYTMGDKISLESYRDNTPEKFMVTSKDVLLMCVIADDCQPYPAKLGINSYDVISFDRTYFNDSNTAINNIWNTQIRNIVNKEVTNFEIIHDGGIVRWKITTN